MTLAEKPSNVLDYGDTISLGLDNNNIQIQESLPGAHKNLCMCFNEIYFLLTKTFRC